MITDVRNVITMDREDLSYDDAVKKVRKETNDWVAKYRRDNAFSGRPSFGCVGLKCGVEVASGGCFFGRRTLHDFLCVFSRASQHFLCFIEAISIYPYM